MIVRPVLYTFGLFASAAMLIFVDYSPSDIANQASLLVLILGAATLGIAAPRWAWLAALVLGGSLAAMHAIYLAAQVPSLPDVTGRLGWCSHIVDLDHSSRHRRIPRSRRGRVGAAAS